MPCAVYTAFRQPHPRVRRLSPRSARIVFRSRRSQRMICGVANLFRSSFPLPGLSYPVSSSLGLVQAYSACAKGIFTLCAFRSVPKCCGTASPRAPPRTALHVWTDLRRYALNFQQPSVGSRQESITVRLRSTTDAGLSPGKGLLDFFSPALSPVLGPPLRSFGLSRFAC